MIKSKKYHWDKKIFIENLFILISFVMFTKIFVEYIKIIITNI